MTATTPGSGLGLAIARGFVEANDGRLTAESLPGQGTTFVVELPLPSARLDCLRALAATANSVDA